MLTGIVVATYFLTKQKQRTPEELAQIALNGEASDTERQKAALELGQVGKGNEQLLQQVLVESQTPEVKAAAIEAIGELKHWESMPKLLDALDDPSPLVRGRAAAIATSMLGIDFGFRAGDPPDKRALAIKGMKRLYQDMLNSPSPARKDRP